ncbi:MAG TPA: FecR domain-containing protein [Allosphingosinicella sp.]
MIREVLDARRLGSMAPEEAAAMWIARRSGGVALEQEPGFAEWLEAGESNRRAWEAGEAALRCFDGSDDDEILQEMRRRALEAEPERAGRWPAVAALAACLALVASASLMLLDRPGQAPAPVIAQAGDPLSNPGRPDFVTGKGQQREVSLPDGSRLTLDTDSAVDVAFSAGRRSLILARGRALFDVERDPGRPFEVRAGDRQVVALGTRFDVQVDPGGMRVRLFEGRVAVSPVGGGGAAVQLSPGEQFSQHGASARVLPAPVEEDALAWRQGLVMFQDESLAAAAAELNRYSTSALLVRDPQIARLRISGAFKAGDPGRFARTVSTIHPVRVRRNSDGSIELLPRG